MFKTIFKHKILSEDNDKDVTILGINEQVQASYVWNLFRESKKDILLVADTLYEANRLYKNFSNEKCAYLFPMDDFLVSEAVAISPDLMVKRIETLNEICNNNSKKLIITNLMGYLRFLPSKKTWKQMYINIKKGDELNRDELIRKLNIIGYNKENTVTKTGEFANRGYILDIYVYGYENPVRIEFFDNIIDEIRTFDPDTQISNGKIENIIISPFTEFINQKKLEDIPKRQSLLPLVSNDVSSIGQYLDSKYEVFIDLTKIKASYNRILEETIEFKETDDYKIDKYMNDLYEIIPSKYVDISTVDNYTKNDNIEKYFTKQIDKFDGNYEKINNYISTMLKQGSKVIICLRNRNIIEDFSQKINFQTVITNFDKLFDNVVNIINVSMNNGFIINDEVYLTEKELFSSDLSHTSYKSKFRYGSKIRDINKLSIGDYVVHSDYGIGRYLGIVTLKQKNLLKDYIHIQYKNNDKLYIPVEKIELISKYSSNEGAVPSLSKLGGTDWAKQKARVKGKVKDIAAQLLTLSAKRKLVKGFSFFADDADQNDFENEFIYNETEDQLRAVEEIKHDMEQTYPMDRLLCGDVGYGKTEVAFRAAFKAIKSGKQVAFLCPTTILSNQHFENAKERFKNFGVNIEVLNRFVSEKNKKRILNDVASGKVDLLIGTHRLLSRDVVYKDLGLLIIDEEQRFGVTHKEKIKEYKDTIDVLTLSATPIPRTLQMSLTGIRGLSLIETPPMDRYPIQTYVLRENDQVIKDAIYKEISRDGQVFILYNRVAKIESLVSRIQKLVPECRITYIHGQMNKNQIETTMDAFVSGEYDVLICTTIIETGIDIQNANTLIVIDADYFGLSQLYQIRGRIGRGKNIAYAYFMYNKHKELNDIAVKRLNAIKEFTELGSGYAIAVRDLAIRGAGDILGSEQSGFIDTIGYDMYLKILNEEVEKLKGTYIEKEEDPNEKPFLQVSTHISNKYADNEELKIEIHKKINMINSFDSFDKVRAELEDRFGHLDDDIIIYMQEELFQAKAKEKNVIKVEQNDKDITMFILKEQLSDKYINDLFMSLYQINKDINVSFAGKILKIKLNILNNKNYINEMIKILEIIV